MASRAESNPPSGPLRFLRDLRFLQALAQVLFVILVLIAGGWLVSNLLGNLESRGLNLSFSFLRRTAGFVVGEGPPMDRSDSYLYAYFVGLVNSVRVVAVGLALATILGLIAGVALLSTNWLVRTIVSAYVEVVRNTPLLVQLFFLYFAVILKLPPLDNPITLGPAVLSQRGFFYPRAVPQAGFSAWLALLVVGIVAAAAVYSVLLRRRIQRGVETRPALWAAIPLLGLPILGWILLPGRPLALESPQLVGLRMEGGSRLTPEFAGILFGLVLYTAAFIADIVRSGILAVPHGQREAATAAGLSRLQTLRLVVLPQALRVIIPPLTNQFLNLSKNSSLAIGVGYPDLYSVSAQIFNHSGQAIQVIALMMGTYLAMSLLISAGMNTLNARLKVVER